MSGSSSPSGETRYNWNEAMEPHWNTLLNHVASPTGSVLYNEDGSLKPRAQYNNGLMGRSVSDLYGMGYNPGDTISGQTRVAPLSRQQQEAQGNILGMSRMSSSPVSSMRDAFGNVGNNPATGQQWGGATNDARLQIEDTLGGRHIYKPGVDPKTGQPYDNSGSNFYADSASWGANPYIGGNEFIDQNSTTSRNAYGGGSSAYRDMVNSGMEDIVSQYQQGTAADTRRAANMAGAFGGSAHQQMQANNEAALGKTLGNYSQQMNNAQYDRSAQMEEGFLGRDLQNQQYNRNTSSGLREAEIGRGFTNYNQGIDRGFQAFENERGRQMGAIGLGQAEQGLAFDRNNQLMGSGALSREYQQGLNTEGFQDWTDSQNYIQNLLGWGSGMFGQAQGQTSPNSQVYQSSSSNAMQGAGGLLALMSMFGGK